MIGTAASTSFGLPRLRETVASGGVAGVDLSFFGCDGTVASGSVAGVHLSFLGCDGALNVLFFAPLGLPHLPGTVALGGVADFGGIYGFFSVISLLIE